MLFFIIPAGLLPAGTASVQNRIRRSESNSSVKTGFAGQNRVRRSELNSSVKIKFVIKIVIIKKDIIVKIDIIQVVMEEFLIGNIAVIIKR